MNDQTQMPDRDKYVSAADYAYGALRQEIVEGRFEPGRRMREIELAQRLGISRTPVRQALSRLELEGLLDLRPRAGLEVSVLDAAAIEELYEMRAALEGTAAAMAARHASRRNIATITALLEEESGLADDPVGLYRHNRKLHEAIHAAAHNRYLMKSLHALHDAVALLGPTTLMVEGRRAVAHAEHEGIVKAIETRDDARANTLANAHVQNALDLRLAILRKEQSR